jgi:hypothetical protein
MIKGSKRPALSWTAESEARRRRRKKHAVKLSVREIQEQRVSVLLRDWRL